MRTTTEQNATNRWEVVKCQLRTKGTSLAEIARELDIQPGSLNQTKYRSMPKYQRAIAAKLGVKPQKIWPDRYVRQSHYVRKAVQKHPVSVSKNA